MSDKSPTRAVLSDPVKASPTTTSLSKFIDEKSSCRTFLISDKVRPKTPVLNKISVIPEKELAEKDGDITLSIDNLKFSGKDFLSSLRNNPICKVKCLNFVNLVFLLKDKNLESDMNAIVEDFFKSVDRLIRKCINNENVKNETVQKKLRSLLVNVLPQNYDIRASQIRELEIDTEDLLQKTVDSIFKKGVEEPKNSASFALMCKNLANMEVTSDNKSVQFGQLLVNRCLVEFEKYIDLETTTKKTKDILDYETKKEKKDRESSPPLVYDSNRVIKSTDIIRFAGELYIQDLIGIKVMDNSIKHFLSVVTDENLEGLCDLLQRVGKTLDMQKVNISATFKKIQSLVVETSSISTKLRFKLLNLIILHDNNWVPPDDTQLTQKIKKEVESSEEDKTTTK